MAAGYTVTTGTSATALAAATPKTLIDLIAGANTQCILTQYAVSFDGISASAVPVLMEWCQSTQATAGTPGSSPTPTLIRGLGTSGATPGINYSIEPTVLTVFDHFFLTPNGGTIVVQFPLGREPQTNLSGSATIKAIALRATAPAIVNVRASLWWDE